MAPSVATGYCGSLTSAWNLNLDALSARSSNDSHRTVREVSAAPSVGKTKDPDVPLGCPPGKRLRSIAQHYTPKQQSEGRARVLPRSMVLDDPGIEGVQFVIRSGQLEASRLRIFCDSVSLTETGCGPRHLRDGVATVVADVREWEPQSFWTPPVNQAFLVRISGHHEIDLGDRSVRVGIPRPGRPRRGWFDNEDIQVVRQFDETGSQLHETISSLHRERGDLGALAATRVHESADGLDGVARIQADRQQTEPAHVWRTAWRRRVLGREPEQADDTTRALVGRSYSHDLGRGVDPPEISSIDGRNFVQVGDRPSEAIAKRLHDRRELLHPDVDRVDPGDR
jgi:hypothetical protein